MRIFFLPLVFLSATCHAQSHLKLELASARISYAEFKEGRKAVDESGSTNSVSINYEMGYGDSWHIRYGYEYERGNLDYAGQTQLGAPLYTQSDHRFNHAYLRLAQTYLSSSLSFSAFTQISPHYWRRNLQSTPDTVSVEIARYWWQADIGLRSSWDFYPQWRLMAEASYGLSFYGKVRLDFRNAGFTKKSANTNQGKFSFFDLQLQRDLGEDWQISGGYLRASTTWNTSDAITYSDPIQVSFFEPQSSLDKNMVFIGVSIRH